MTLNDLESTLRKVRQINWQRLRHKKKKIIYRQKSFRSCWITQLVMAALLQKERERPLQKKKKKIALNRQHKCRWLKIEKKTRRKNRDNGNPSTMRHDTATYKTREGSVSGSRETVRIGHEKKNYIFF